MLRELELSLKQGSQTLAGVRKSPLQGSWIRSAKACGNREFVATAAACIDSSTLAVAGTITVRDRTTGDTLVHGASVTGRMMVMGLHLSNATLSLNHEQGSAEFLSDDGEVFQLQSLSD